MCGRGKRIEITQRRHDSVLRGGGGQLHRRRRGPRSRRGLRGLGRPSRRPPGRPDPRALLPVREPRRARQAPRPDRGGPAPASRRTRPGPGDLRRRRQRHHPPRHRPRRRRGALREGRGPADLRRRHGHGDHRLRHPGRPGSQASARQDRDVQRACARGRRPLRLPRARPVVPQDRPGPPCLGRRPAASLARGAHAVALRAGQALGVEVPADPDQPWPAQPPRGTLEVRRDDIHWAREFLVPWIGRRLRGESSGDHVAAKRPDLLPL